LGNQKKVKAKKKLASPITPCAAAERLLLRPALRSAKKTHIPFSPSFRMGLLTVDPLRGNYVFAKVSLQFASGGLSLNSDIQAGRWVIYNNPKLLPGGKKTKRSRALALQRFSFEKPRKLYIWTNANYLILCGIYLSSSVLRMTFLPMFKKLVSSPLWKRN
jgi:hypothetical protein